MTTKITACPNCGGTHSPVQHAAGDNQPRYSMRRMRDEIARVKVFERRVVLEEAIVIVAENNVATAIRELRKLMTSQPPSPDVAGLTAWTGWDQSDLPWSEAKHKDRVCYAAFGETWSMEDAEALIDFIDRTWPRAAATETDHG